MTPSTPDTLSRLRAANPVGVGDEDGHGPVARAALARILAEPLIEAGSPRKRRPRRSPRGLALVLAALVVGAGGAVAATDPFGWRSANPDTARYGVNPASHVRTPSAQEITCRPRATASFRCVAGHSGQTYIQIDAIPRPAGPLWSRAHFAAFITGQLATGKLKAAAAARLRTDLAHVPDGFFTEMQVGSRFATYSGGADSGRVPPPGVPGYLVCENAHGLSLACQDLNGDLAAPIGAGVYQATPAPDWRQAPAHRRDSYLPPGMSPITRPEFRFLADLLRLTAVGHSSHGSGPHYSRPVAPAVARARTRQSARTSSSRRRASGS
jgi:hypothetical protein